MDQFGFYSEEETFVLWTDLLFNALLGFVFMFVVAFLMINPQAKTGAVDTDAEFLISVQWPDRHPDDVDTYVEDPLGNIVWYKSKEAGLMHLDRDDRGNYLDEVTVNGQKLTNPLNKEIVSLRGIVPGEYVVDIQHFIDEDPTDGDVPVTVTVEKINPTATVVFYNTLQLHGANDEQTAVRFTVEPDGSVKDINARPKMLTRELRRVGRVRQSP